MLVMPIGNTQKIHTHCFVNGVSLRKFKKDAYVYKKLVISPKQIIFK